MLISIIDWVPEDDFNPEDTDTVADFEKNQFLDLRQPLLWQVWTANFTKSYYLQQVHQPRHLPESARLFGPDCLEVRLCALAQLVATANEYNIDTHTHGVVCRTYRLASYRWVLLPAIARSVQCIRTTSTVPHRPLETSHYPAYPPEFRLRVRPDDRMFPFRQLRLDAAGIHIPSLPLPHR